MLDSLVAPVFCGAGVVMACSIPSEVREDGSSDRVTQSDAIGHEKVPELVCPALLVRAVPAQLARLHGFPGGVVSL
ncbi:hypothetical protein RE9427_48850 (plasmid) [Prescottella equi]|nr:hypothetical protein RE9427_48850 [Prescottella equi]